MQCILSARSQYDNPGTHGYGTWNAGVQGNPGNYGSNRNNLFILYYLDKVESEPLSYIDMNLVRDIEVMIMIVCALKHVNTSETCLTELLK